MSAAGESSAASSSSNATISSTIPTSSNSSVDSTSTTAVSKQNDKQFDGAALLATLAMTVFELGITVSASYLFSRWIAKLMMKQNRAGGEDEMDSGIYSPDDSAAGASSGGQVVAKLKKLLAARQESTLSAMMEEFEFEDEDINHDYNYNRNNANGKRQQQQEEKKEEYSDKVGVGGEHDGAHAETKEKRRQYHIQQLQTELQSRHISSLQSLNYLTPYELSIARNNLVDPADISVAFGDVGGMDEIKSEIYDLVVLPLLRPDLFDCESGLVNPPKGILLYG